MVNTAPEAMARDERRDRWHGLRVALAPARSAQRCAQPPAARPEEARDPGSVRAPASCGPRTERAPRRGRTRCRSPSVRADIHAAAGAAPSRRACQPVPATGPAACPRKRSAGRFIQEQRACAGRRTEPAVRATDRADPDANGRGAAPHGPGLGSGTARRPGPARISGIPHRTRPPARVDTEADRVPSRP